RPHRGRPVGGAPPPDRPPARPPGSGLRGRREDVAGRLWGWAPPYSHGCGPDLCRHRQSGEALVSGVDLGMPEAPPPVLAQRRPTRKIKVGSIDVGGDAPVSVQSMTTTLTSDI